MAKHSVKEWRDRGVLSPIAAFVFDRWYIYAPVMLISILAIVALCFQGMRALDTMAAEPEGDSPYREMEARDFLGKRFIADLVEQHPDDIDSDDWDADDSPRTPSAVFSVDTCPEMGDVPNSLLTTYRGDSSDLTVYGRVYGAGQARDQFDRVSGVLEDCDDISDFNETTTDTDPELPMVSFESESDIAIFTVGDVIIEVRASDDMDIDDAVDFYADYAIDSMQYEEWQCHNLTPSSSASERSFFYDFANYRGLFDDEELVNETDIDGLPTPVLTKNGNDEASSVIDSVANPNSSVPESPLPDDMEEEISREPSQPVIPQEFEIVDEFSEVAEYEIADYEGPGCGWNWSAQLSPVYDEETLEHNRDVILTETQNGLENRSHNYIQSGLEYTLSTLHQDSVITRWNEWVSETDEIHEDWQWLEDERDAFWSTWRDFLADHEEWSTFPDRQEEAQEEYDELVEQCMDQREELEEWEDEYGDAVRNGEAVIRSAFYDNNGNDGRRMNILPATGSSDEEDDDDDSDDEEEDSNSSNRNEDDDSDDEDSNRDDDSDEDEEEEDLPEVPPRPSGCDDLPDEPEILNEDRGDEPQAPEPENERVTIPDSWDNPTED